MAVLSFREVENKERKLRDEGDAYVLKAIHFVKNIDTLNNSGYETLFFSKLNKDKKYIQCTVYIKNTSLAWCKTIMTLKIKI